MFEKFEGRKVIVRSSASGVWHGEFVNGQISGGRAVVNLSNARRIWRWEGRALDCSGLAIHGPTTAKISGVRPDVLVADVCEIQESTDEATTRIEAVQPWNG